MRRKYNAAVDAAQEMIRYFPAYLPAQAIPGRNLCGPGPGGTGPRKGVPVYRRCPPTPAGYLQIFGMLQTPGGELGVNNIALRARRVILAPR